MSGVHCVVEALENPRLNGILLGLEEKDKLLELREDFFPCCQARGFRPINDVGLARCGLRRRLESVQRIWSQFFYFWPKFSSDFILNSNASSAEVLKSVSEAIKGQAPQASSLEGVKYRPGKLWLMAMACSWRFGLDVHIVSTSFKGQQRILPSIEQTKRPLAIFVEQVVKVWDESSLETLRSLISFAYNSNALLWIEFCNSEQSSRTFQSSSSVSSKLSSRVQKAKNKSPMELLGAKSAARLESMYELPVISLGNREI